MKKKITKIISSLLIFLLCVHQAQAFLYSKICDTKMPIEYEVTTSPFKESPIPLRVGVLRFEDLRSTSDIVFNVPLNRGYTKNLIKQLSQSNVFKEAKEVPLGILKKFEGRYLDKNIAREIGDELKVDTLLCGKIGKLRIDTIRSKFYSYEYSTESVFNVMLIDTHKGEVIWAGTFERKAKKEQGINPFVDFGERKLLNDLILRAIKETNEGIQKGIISDMTNEEIKDYSSDCFVPRIVVKGNSEEKDVFFRAKQEEVKKAGSSLANTVILIEVLPSVLMFNMAVYYFYPLVAIPSWFIANSIGQANIRKVVEERKKIFFEEADTTDEIEFGTTTDNLLPEAIEVGD